MTTIRFADGRTPITCATTTDAAARLRVLYPDGVSESDGVRTLWWACAEDADDDTGARAVAEVTP